MKLKPKINLKGKPQEYLEFLLRDSAKDRRKQIWEICRTYADKRIVRSGPEVFKAFDDKVVSVEEANSIRSIVKVYTQE